MDRKAPWSRVSKPLICASMDWWRGRDPSLRNSRCYPCRGGVLLKKCDLLEILGAEVNGVNIKTNYFEIQIMTENYHDYIYIYIYRYVYAWIISKYKEWLRIITIIYRYIYIYMYTWIVLKYKEGLRIITLIYIYIYMYTHIYIYI